ncbi:50S ribosomal protein L34 [Sphingobium sp.]|uniref:50S ribosomal protein L34 n=1 Tax=Sphingobium sp. TaxID=1912891 RepID=UPI00338F279C
MSADLQGQCLWRQRTSGFRARMPQSQGRSAVERRSQIYLCRHRQRQLQPSGISERPV